MRAAWPTNTELATELTAKSITLPSWLTAANVVEIVIAEWEDATGWSPWLAEASASHTYTAQGTGGIVLRSGMTTITAVSVDGTALDTSVWRAMPEGAGRFTAVHFDGTLLSSYGTVTITGTAGWGQIPEAVWAAVFKRMVEYSAEASTTATTGATGGAVKREKVGSVEIEYESTKATHHFDDALVTRYRRRG